MQLKDFLVQLVYICLCTYIGLDLMVINDSTVQRDCSETAGAR